MKNTGGSGTVVVMVQVGPDDKAKSFHVMMSSGSKSLDDEAIRTLKGWSYRSAIKNGAPVDGYVQVPITFNK
jgi:protein TonB